MTPVSAVIITFNEERNIGRCLDSLKAIADDIVVLDSFSTDATEKICREKGARFFQHSFDGHIEQKNLALTYAKFPHVLSLDADECLSDTLQQCILQAKENFLCDGYKMNRLNNYCGKWIRHTVWYPDRKLRLWNKEKGNWGGLNPHDKVEMGKGSSIGFLNGDLLHYSFTSVEEHRNRNEHYAMLMAGSMFNKKMNVSKWTIPFRFIFSFFHSYILKSGWMDGNEGFIISKFYAVYTKRKYELLWQYTHGKSPLPECCT